MGKKGMTRVFFGLGEMRKIERRKIGFFRNIYRTC